MRWTKEEIDFLKENYPSEMLVQELSERLNKTIRSIRHKAAREMLSKPRVPHNKPKNKNHRNIVDKEYYEKNKKRIYQMKRARLKRKKIELVIILGGKCNNCGYERCMAALEFHHKRNKENAIATMIRDISKQKALKEIEKCILLCANCHRELHHKGI
tara:strand:+ start:1449 stop:1922 length:474 start_codon:yes stop_codon:yes gene_type:complete